MPEGSEERSSPRGPRVLAPAEGSVGYTWMATASHECKADLGPPHSSSEKAEPCLPGPSPRRPGAAAAPRRVGGHAPHPPIRGAAADPLKAWGARSRSPPFQPQHISGNVENTPRRRDILELVVGRPRPLPLELGCIISPNRTEQSHLKLACLQERKAARPALPCPGPGWAGAAGCWRLALRGKRKR